MDISALRRYYVLNHLQVYALFVAIFHLDNYSLLLFFLLVPSDDKRQWEYQPNLKLKVGDLVTGGDILGSVFENNLFKDHKIMVPPKSQGKIKYLADPGSYTVSDIVAEVEFHGKVRFKKCVFLVFCCFSFCTWCSRIRQRKSAYRISGRCANPDPSLTNYLALLRCSLGSVFLIAFSRRLKGAPVPSLGLLA